MDGGTYLRSIFVAPTTSFSKSSLIYSLSFLNAHPLSHPPSYSFSVPELLKTKGQVVILTSKAAQLRAPNASEFCLSKHAINRFAEFITIGET
jgi:short-subunit dehydrogenase